MIFEFGFNFFLVLILLLIGTITDVYFRRIIPVLAYVCIIYGFVSAITYLSITTDVGFTFIYAGQFLVTYGLLYYLVNIKAWGGGDAKVLLAISALIGATVTYAMFIAILFILIELYAYLKRIKAPLIQKNIPGIPIFLTSYILAIITYAAMK